MRISSLIVALTLSGIGVFVKANLATNRRVLTDMAFYSHAAYYWDLETAGNDYRVGYLDGKWSTGTEFKVLTVMKANKDWVYNVEITNRDECVIVFKGSDWQGGDWNRNLSAFFGVTTSTDMSPYKVFHGYWEHGHELIMGKTGGADHVERINSFIQGCNEEGKQVYITGHSLGGTAAIFLAMALHDGMYGLNTDQNVKVVTFGQMRFVNDNDGERCPARLKSSANSVRVVLYKRKNWRRNEIDPATRIPFGNFWSAKKFCSEAVRLENNSKAIEKKNTFFPNKEWNPSLTNFALHDAGKYYGKLRAGL